MQDGCCLVERDAPTSGGATTKYPYGGAYSIEGQTLDYGYTGHTWDDETGLYYAAYRYYNPTTARWNMRDPLGMVEGPNMYAYLLGSAVSSADPLGLGPCEEARDACLENARKAYDAAINTIEN